MKVSALQCGKQELVGDGTVEFVDRLWTETFGLPAPCLLFQHSGNQYENDIEANTCRLAECPDTLTAAKVIIANGERAVVMYDTETWNGVSFQKTDWDGNVPRAAERWAKELKEAGVR